MARLIREARNDSEQAGAGDPSVRRIVRRFAVGELNEDQAMTALRQRAWKTGHRSTDNELENVGDDGDLVELANATASGYISQEMYEKITKFLVERKPE